MKTKININFKKGIKAASALALGLAAIIPAANSYAWGPSRTTYTNEKPSDHVQFNSITNNGTIGDERDFVRVAEDKGDGKYTWTNNLKISPGKKYLVMIYYHNNAASNLNEKGTGMATNARVKSHFPSTVNSSKKGEVYAEISADNASPKSVWDEAYFTTDSKADVVLKYVAASAKIYNQGKANGNTLSDTALFSSTGQLLGYNSLIGNLPGCSEYSGQIVYSLYASQVGAKVQKTASLDGKNFTENVTAKPGDTVTYRVEFTNTGTTDLTNVTFHDKMPAGVTLINGTTKLINAANPNGVKMVDLIGKNGFKTGTYGPGATAVLTYQVKVNSDVVANASCGAHQFKNQIFVNHDAGEINDTSTVTVNKDCGGNTPTCENGGKSEKECNPTCANGGITGPECDKPTCENGLLTGPECEDQKDKCEPDENGNYPAECTLPKTGPAEILLAVVAIVCIATGIAYWYHSQQEVAKVTNKIAGKNKKS